MKKIHNPKPRESLMNGVVSIVIDPANYIVACSRSGQVVVLTPFEMKYNYIYLDLGESTFCTVNLPSSRAREVGQIERQVAEFSTESN